MPNALELMVQEFLAWSFVTYEYFYSKPHVRSRCIWQSIKCVVWCEISVYRFWYNSPMRCLVGAYIIDNRNGKAK